ncbi:primosomal protein N' [Kyrpidia sp.]|uniref:primosomal protein N' n=1 Tax=Kyrpidia sp. TaxID=2073077 RepID=UPI00258E762F|nr:primosomal protein N' [Kyrpidia sp.]MCL6575936.1 primosomal protein N' [Kyrpidia sp.]
MIAVEVLTELRVQAVDRTFTYRVPESLKSWALPGARVLVPFGRRSVMGIIVERTDPQLAESLSGLKPIRDVLDTEPVVPRDLLELAEWLSERYLCTRSAAFRTVLPPGAFGKVNRYYEPGPGAGEAAHIAGVGGGVMGRLARRPLSREQLLAALGGDLGTLRTGLARGWWVERTEGQVVGPKTVQVAVPVLDKKSLQEAAERMRGRAPRQAELLTWWLSRDLDPLPVGEMARLSGVSREAVSGLVKRGLVQLESRAIRRDPGSGRDPGWDTGERPELNEDQRRALAAIVTQMEAPDHRPVLLYGVTGSGKTEVYLRAMEEALRRGRRAIVLVPEIALTPQTVARFRGRFGEQVAVLHSRLSPGERHDEWMRLRRGEASVAVGARSAIFAPVDHLGLVVMDEEHEVSYKQEESPRYVTREVAWKRAAQHGAVLVLGSATPSLEAIHLVERGRAVSTSLKERVGGRPLPECVVVDMRRELREGNRSMFSRRLQREMAERLDRGEQAVILMNRRGYSTFVLCRACGHVMRCPHCDISLTYHRSGEDLRCHYCGYTTPYVETCPNCGSPYIRYFGTGTQRVEEELRHLFPTAEIVRMDVDTTRRKGAHEELLGRFARGEANILLGTQMIAKGLDFPNVGLVGVISADTSLHVPDFRAAERTYQLLVQVAGRSGRGDTPGITVIQTYNPDHYAIRAAADQQPRVFYLRELAGRRAGDYPPFSELAVWRTGHPEADRAARAAGSIERRLKEVMPPGAGRVLRAGPAPLGRLRGLYRHQVVVKYRQWSDVAEAFREVWRESAGLCDPEGSVSVDVAAQMLL